MTDDKNSTPLEKSNSVYLNPSVSEFIEQLAKIEHDQWVHYSKDVAKRIRDANSLNNILDNTVNKWSSKWVDYSLLSTSDKELDRVWAYKVLQLLKANKSVVELILATD